jgi:hypothetical protein
VRISNFTIVNYSTWQEYYTDVVGPVPAISNYHETILQNGFTKIKELRHGGQPDGNIYETLKVTSNSDNFDQHLREFYKHALVEVVNETIFFTNEIFTTEKFLQSVYGYTLPILISSPGAVGYLRQHGFDMFDDVIDHTYDSISNPIHRIFAAIESNIRLLSDKKYAYSVWKHCQGRMDKNYQYAKYNMYDYFYNQFLVKFNKYLVEFDGY